MMMMRSDEEETGEFTDYLRELDDDEEEVDTGEFFDSLHDMNDDSVDEMERMAQEARARMTK